MRRKKGGDCIELMCWIVVIIIIIAILIGLIHPAAGLVVALLLLLFVGAFLISDVNVKVEKEW